MKLCSGTQAVTGDAACEISTEFAACEAAAGSTSFGGSTVNATRSGLCLQQQLCYSETRGDRLALLGIRRTNSQLQQEFPSGGFTPGECLALSSSTLQAQGSAIAAQFAAVLTTIRTSILAAAANAGATQESFPESTLRTLPLLRTQDQTLCQDRRLFQLTGGDDPANLWHALAVTGASAAKQLDILRDAIKNDIETRRDTSQFTGEVKAISIAEYTNFVVGEDIEIDTGRDTEKDVIYLAAACGVVLLLCLLCCCCGIFGHRRKKKAASLLEKTERAKKSKKKRREKSPSVRSPEVSSSRSVPTRAASKKSESTKKRTVSQVALQGIAPGDQVLPPKSPSSSVSSFEESHGSGCSGSVPSYRDSTVPTIDPPPERRYGTNVRVRRLRDAHRDEDTHSYSQRGGGERRSYSTSTHTSDTWSSDSYSSSDDSASYFSESTRSRSSAGKLSRRPSRSRSRSAVNIAKIPIEFSSLSESSRSVDSVESFEALNRSHSDRFSRLKRRHRR
ncbi:MAG: hypothetical protein MHM6MM_001395 [Cercozoa sp. M6MM]